MANRHPYPKILEDGPEPVLDLRRLDPAADPAAVDPDHHLWRNGRLWWVAFTVHLPGWRKERVRTSLRTADLAEARRRRDDLLSRYPSARGCELSLRLAPPSRRRQRPPRRRHLRGAHPGDRAGRAREVARADRARAARDLTTCPTRDRCASRTTRPPCSAGERVSAT